MKMSNPNREPLFGEHRVEVVFAWHFVRDLVVVCTQRFSTGPGCACPPGSIRSRCVS